MHRIIGKKYDVVVIGGGPGGVPAALKAARRGRSVALIEKNQFLGGAAASGLGILGYLDRSGRKALGGIPYEIVERLKLTKGTLGHDKCPVHNSITAISPEETKIVLLEMCLDAGVDVYFSQELLDVFVCNGKLTEISTYSKCTEIRFSSPVFIDATGDGDLAYMAGVDFHRGQEGTSIMQPATLMFTITGYDEDKFFSFVENNPSEYGIKEDYAKGYDISFFRNTPSHCFIGLTKTIEKARENGDFNIPRNQFIYITTPLKNHLAVNTTRIIDIDASDPISLSKGLEKGYLQIRELMDFFHKYVPGFENVMISSISPTLGVRETRHFGGEYTLTKENMYSRETIENAIALSAYNIDIHAGNASHIDLTPLSKGFGIPYGTMVPKKLDGLLLSGRTISAEREPYASLRVMGTCMAIGEAAGEAASMALENGVEVREVNVNDLRNRLRKDGVILPELEKS